MENHDLDLRDTPECTKCSVHEAEIEAFEIASLLFAFIGISVGILIGLFVGKKLLNK